MSTNEKSYKSGHPVLAIVLGIVGIVAALLSIFTGIIGGAIGGAFGLAALLIGISSRKYGKGLGGIVTGVIALLLAVTITSAAIGFYKGMQESAAKHKDIAPLVNNYLDQPELGLVGMFIDVSKNHESLDQLSKEIDALSKLSETSDAPSTPAATDAPATTDAPAATDVPAATAAPAQ